MGEGGDVLSFISRPYVVEVWLNATTEVLSPDHHVLGRGRPVAAVTARWKDHFELHL